MILLPDRLDVVVSALIFLLLLHIYLYSDDGGYSQDAVMIEVGAGNILCITPAL